MIVVVDYGLGNVRSTLGAVQRLGFEAKISGKTEDFQKAEKLILPGVGAFADGMRLLNERNLVEPLNDVVLKKRTPILGICLGFQLMAKSGSEYGACQGLGWLDAMVTPLEKTDDSLRIPHVGWNNLNQEKPVPLFNNVPKEALFYYTHSYHVDCHDSEIILGTCDYGSEFVASAQKDNIFGTQFHPEKSQLSGLELLKNYLTLQTPIC